MVLSWVRIVKNNKATIHNANKIETEVQCSTWDRAYQSAHEQNGEKQNQNQVIYAVKSKDKAGGH